MKKKITVGIGLLIIITIGIICFLINNDKKTLLAGRYYVNYAWGFRCSGVALFDDGTIYTWTNDNNQIDSKDYEKAKLDTYSGFKKFALKHGKLSDKKISSEDIKELKSLLKQLDSVNKGLVIDEDNVMFDAGSVVIYGYNHHEAYPLKLWGDKSGHSPNRAAPQLLEIIEKYTN